MLLVSPLIAPGSVSHQVYDHTSIIKTILQRFCRASDGALPQMGARVAAASGLGAVLTLGQPRAAPAVPFAVLAQRAAWETDVRALDFAPLAGARQPDTELEHPGELATAVAVPLQTDAEAGVIAAHRQLARSARNAQAAHGKAASPPAGRRQRQGGKLAPSRAQSGKGTVDGGGR